MKISIGSDHGGYQLKTEIANRFEPTDCETEAPELFELAKGIIEKIIGISGFSMGREAISDISSVDIRSETSS